MKFYDDLDMHTNQIVNGKFETVSTLPTTNLFKGRMVYNETDGKNYVYNGTKWVYNVDSEDLGNIQTILASVVEVN